MKKSKAKDVSANHSDHLYQLIYKALSSNTSDLIYLINKDCSAIECNENLLKLLGIKNIDKDMIGALYNHMKDSEYWTEKQVQMMKSKDIEVLLSGKPELEHFEPPVLDKTEHIHHYVASRIPILDESQSVMGLLVIFKEVTQQKLMEEQFEKIKLELEKYNAQECEPVKSKSHIILKENGPDESLTPIRVLVIEDNLIAQKAAQAVLMQLDCVVDTAKSEQEVKDLFKPGKYAMVFMDIGLEETTGYMLAKAIRQQEKDTEYHVPVIALTGFNAELLTGDCDYYKMEGAITKPLTLEQARQLIQRYIHKIDVNVKGLNLAAPLN